MKGHDRIGGLDRVGRGNGEPVARPEPGPSLLSREPKLVWALIASLFIGNTMLLLLNLPLAPAWAKLLQIPRPYLYAGILFFASMGAYAVNGSPFDLYLLLVLGLLGFVMRRFGLPVLPMIVGVILGPMAEKHLRRSLQVSGGEISGLLGGPVTWVAYALVVLNFLSLILGAENQGGAAGHLGGAAAGWYFIRHPHHLHGFFDILGRADPTSHHYRAAGWRRRLASRGRNDGEAEVDRILDRVRASGTHSLTPRERQTLMEATERHRGR